MLRGAELIAIAFFNFLTFLKADFLLQMTALSIMRSSRHPPSKMMLTTSY